MNHTRSSLGSMKKLCMDHFYMELFYQTQNQVALNQPRAHEFTSRAEPVSGICIFMVNFSHSGTERDHPHRRGSVLQLRAKSLSFSPDHAAAPLFVVILFIKF